eukprot:4792338-Amphidinium_carterae.1
MFLPGGGHELEVHEVTTLDGDSCGYILLCTTCGAYSGARGRSLLRLCMGTPRIHKRSGLLRQCSRAMQGLHPAPAGKYRHCTITFVQKVSAEEVHAIGMASQDGR